MEELAQLEQLIRNQTSSNEQFLISSIRGDEMNQISNGAILLNILNIVQKLEAGEKFTKSLNFDAPGKSLTLLDPLIGRYPAYKKFCRPLDTSET